MNLAKHFVQKWKFGKMEIWNAFFYKTSRNGIPFHRENTVVDEERDDSVEGSCCVEINDRQICSQLK